MMHKEKSNNKDQCQTKKVAFTLPLETIEKLDKIASRHGITMSDAIRRAVATVDYLDNEIQEDSKILIQKPDNSLIEVVFK